MHVALTPQRWRNSGKQRLVGGERERENAGKVRCFFFPLTLEENVKRTNESEGENLTTFFFFLFPFFLEKLLLFRVYLSTCLFFPLFSLSFCVHQDDSSVVSALVAPHNTEREATWCSNRKKKASDSNFCSFIDDARLGGTTRTLKKEHPSFAFHGRSAPDLDLPTTN